MDCLANRPFSLFTQRYMSKINTVEKNNVRNVVGDEFIIHIRLKAL
jgi:hypothetical protein